MHNHPHETTSNTRGRIIRWAKNYDRAVYLLSLGQVKQIQQKLINFAQLTPEQQILDVGCGTGTLCLAIKQQLGANSQVIGVDASPEMIEHAQRKAKHAGLNLDFQVQAVEQLSFPDSTFDRVFSTLMIHHLPDQLKLQAFLEIKRVLKPQGRLMILDFARPNSFGSKIISHLTLHKRLKTGVYDLDATLKQAGFSQIEHYPPSNGVFGFLSAA